MAGRSVLTFPEVPTAPQCRASKIQLPATKQAAGSAENFILFHCPLDGEQFIMQHTIRFWRWLRPVDVGALIERPRAIDNRPYMLDRSVFEFYNRVFP